MVKQRVYGIVVEILKKGVISIDWLLRIFNKCMESGVVQEDWKTREYRSSIHREI